MNSMILSGYFIIWLLQHSMDHLETIQTLSVCQYSVIKQQVFHTLI